MLAKRGYARKKTIVEITLCSHCNCDPCEFNQYINGKITIKEFNKLCLNNHRGIPNSNILQELIENLNDDTIYDYLDDCIYKISCNNILLNCLIEKFNNTLQQNNSIPNNFIELIISIFLIVHNKWFNNFVNQFKMCILKFIKINKNCDNGDNLTENSIKYLNNIIMIITIIYQNSCQTNIGALDNFIFELLSMNVTNVNIQEIFGDNLNILEKSINDNIDKITLILLNKQNNYKIFPKTLSYISTTQKMDINKLNIDKKCVNEYNIDIYYSFGYMITKDDYTNIIENYSQYTKNLTLLN